MVPVMLIMYVTSNQIVSDMKPLSPHRKAKKKKNVNFLQNITHTIALYYKCIQKSKKKNLIFSKILHIL
jgi:hypothetical protein